MRVLMLPDAEFLRRERAMLERLEIGLADEGARVLHASPLSALGGSDAEHPQVYSTAIHWHDRGLPFTLGLRATALVRTLDAAAPVDGSVRGERLVDVVYAAGEDAWPMALTVARRTHAVPVLHVWSPAVIAKAGAVWRRWRSPAAGLGVGIADRGGPGLRGRTPLFLAAGARLAEQLARRVPAECVGLAPIGVHPGDGERRPLDPGASLSMALLASGQEPDAVRAAVESLDRLVASGLGQLLLFVDATLARRLPLWRWAGGRDGHLPERMSVIADLEANRELILSADVLLMPEAAGEHGTLALDAMAGGCLVVARADADVDYLLDGRTATLVPRATADGLAEAVGTLVRDPGRVARQRQTAWEYINAERSASQQVRAMWQAFERVTGTRA